MAQRPRVALPILKEKAPRTCWQEVGHCQRTDSWPPLSGVPWPASIFLPGRRSPKSQEKPQQRLLIIMQLVGHLFLSTLTFTISRSISFLPPCLAWPPSSPSPSPVYLEQSCYLLGFLSLATPNVHPQTTAVWDVTSTPKNTILRLRPVW